MHEVVIIIAKYFIGLSLLAAAWIFIKLPRNRQKEFALLALLGGALAVLFAKIGSHVYFDPRPFVAGHFTPYFSHGADNGFPSDHTLLASFLMFLGWRYSKKFGVVLLVLALLIGLARVVAGVHHLVDLAGSFACSAAGFYVAVWIVQMIQARRHLNEKE